MALIRNHFYDHLATHNDSENFYTDMMVRNLIIDLQSTQPRCLLILAELLSLWLL